MRRSFCFSRSCNPYSERRCFRSLLTPPGGTSSLHFDSRGFTPLFRNRSVPSRRDSLHFGPVYFAITNPWDLLGQTLNLGQTLDATLFRRTTAVMGDRSHIFNVGDLEPTPVQCAHGGFAARAGTHHPDLDVLHAMLLGRRACALRSNLRRKGGRFAGTAETATPRGCPRQCIALPIGDRDDGVVERCVHVRNRV